MSGRILSLLVLQRNIQYDLDFLNKDDNGVIKSDNHELGVPDLRELHSIAGKAVVLVVDVDIVR